MRKKLSVGKTLLFLAVFCGLGYLAYDQYFQLPSDSPSGQTAGETEQAEFDKFNVLILGVDGRQGVNDRADTIILASLDGKTKEAQVLSVPRDTRVKIKGAWDKINAAYAYGGVSLTEKTLRDFLGVDIDRSVVLDFDSVVKLADEVGGLEVDVPVRMHVPLEGIDLYPGKQHLNGQQVLAYCRYRYTSEGDIGRAARQQEILSLLAKKVLSPQYLPQLPHLLQVIKDNVKTDLTVKEMIALARIAPDALDKGVTSKILPGKNKKIDGIWYWEPDESALAGITDLPEERPLALK